ncbi:MAG: hypothetical protein RL761_217, partial [Pseudomonadota bacterium]
QAGAAFSENAMPQAVDAAVALSLDINAHRNAAASALQFSASHQGAAEKTAAAVVNLLSELT